jgi:hypothetical protein
MQSVEGHPVFERDMLSLSLGSKNKPRSSFTLEIEASNMFIRNGSWTYIPEDRRKEGTCLQIVRFEVFTAATMKNGVFWDVTPCGSWYFFAACVGC